MKFTIASAVNNNEILESCLLASPDIHDACEVLLQRGFASAATAYNAAIINAQNDIVILVHQDLYLPNGWFNELANTLEKLSVEDPNWGVLGVYGITPSGEYHGHLYCNANQSILGKPLDGPREVGTLDEIVLVIRKSSGLRFDESLEGFHFYATDLCLMAKKTGMKSYAIPGFCVHNAHEYGMFPRSFWNGFLFLRRKWRENLPVRTPCVKIERNLWPIIKSTAWRFCWLQKNRKPLNPRVKDPAKLYFDEMKNWRIGGTPNMLDESIIKNHGHGLGSV